VVDCAGRTTRWKKWFEKNGIPLPRETVVDSNCGYSSRFYRPRNPAQFSWKGMVVDCIYPQQPHWGVIVPLERNDWIVTLGGFGGEYPPSDEAGFEQFARNLRTPDYFRALSEAERLALGISEGFIRVSVGIEDSDLLKREFSAAVAAV